MNGHGIALAAINDWSLFMQCECGWHHALSSPCTLDYATELGARHREEAARGSGELPLVRDDV